MGFINDEQRAGGPCDIAQGFVEAIFHQHHASIGQKRFGQHASHIAVGQSYTENIRDGSKRSKEELAALGANASLVHVDWMIGSGELDVDGILADGRAEPLMRKGEWAI